MGQQRGAVAVARSRSRSRMPRSVLPGLSPHAMIDEEHSLHRISNSRCQAVMAKVKALSEKLRVQKDDDR